MADGVQVGEVITKEVGQTVTEAEFPAVPAKEGFTGKWNVTGDITATTVVEAVYEAIPVIPEEPEEPSEDAPIYTIFAGETELGYGNVADGKELFTGGTWADMEDGQFPLMVQITNAEAALGGTFVVKYDATKVTPLTYKTGKGGGWIAATEGTATWFSSEFSGGIGTGSTASGMYVDGENAYVYANWIASKGKFNAENVLAGGSNPEVGTFVFKTNDGVKFADFDANTFTIVTDVLADGNPIKTGLASNGSPLTCNVEVNGVSRAFGISDTAEREPMTVLFSYPNSDKVPGGETPTPETFTVTFMADGVQVGEVITKEVGQTVTEAEFPAVPAKEGFTGKWNVTGDITATTVVEAVYELIPVETFTVTFMVDGVQVGEITKNAGETVTVAEFPEVEDKAGYTFAWDVTEDITATTTVTGTYTPVAVEGLKLIDLETTGFSVGTFDADTMNYAAVAEDAFDGNYYVIKGIAADGVEVSYIVDGIEAEYIVDGALYFDMMAGTTSSIQIKLVDGEDETIYTVDVTALEATNEFFFTSGFDFDFDADVDTYTVTGNAQEAYLRLWAPAYSGMTIEYAVGGANDTAEAAEYAALAVGCDERENAFANTPNFDENWATKSFVNLWTEDLAETNKMFIKVTVDGESVFYTVNFN